MRPPLIILIITAFLLTSLGPLPVQAQEIVLPKIGVMVPLSPEFTPAHLQGITIHPDNALQFDFIIHKGDGQLSDTQKKEEYTKLVKYFLASLTIADEDQWVNLSPYEKDRIIQDNFGKTEMGRDLLSQDYMLKQITASLIYPEQGLGKKFWEEIYERAWKEYHTTEVPVSTFNKVWIVPDQATIYESGNTAYILKSHLKVMLEEDYTALSHTVIPAKAGIQNTSTLGSEIIRKVILPALEKEVNEGKNFAMLRQIYSGMVLATWYKRALKESLLGKIYADRAKVKGVDQDPKSNEAIYKTYLAAFKKGVFNYIKEDQDKYTHETIPRKYFSGGFGRTRGMGASDISVLHSPAQVSSDPALMADVAHTKVTDLEQATVDVHAAEDRQLSPKVQSSHLVNPAMPAKDNNNWENSEFSQAYWDRKLEEFHRAMKDENFVIAKKILIETQAAKKGEYFSHFAEIFRTYWQSRFKMGWQAVTDGNFYLAKAILMEMENDGVQETIWYKDLYSTYWNARVRLGQSLVTSGYFIDRANIILREMQQDRMENTSFYRELYSTVQAAKFSDQAPESADVLTPQDIPAALSLPYQAVIQYVQEMFLSLRPKEFLVISHGDILKATHIEIGYDTFAELMGYLAKNWKTKSVFKGSVPDKMTFETEEGSIEKPFNNWVANVSKSPAMTVVEAKSMFEQIFERHKVNGASLDSRFQERMDSIFSFKDLYNYILIVIDKQNRKLSHARPGDDVDTTLTGHMRELSKQIAGVIMAENDAREGVVPTSAAMTATGSASSAAMALPVTMTDSQINDVLRRRLEDNPFLMDQIFLMIKDPQYELEQRLEKAFALTIGVDLFLVDQVRRDASGRMIYVFNPNVRAFVKKYVVKTGESVFDWTINYNGPVLTEQEDIAREFTEIREQIKGWASRPDTAQALTALAREEGVFTGSLGELQLRRDKIIRSAMMNMAQDMKFSPTRLFFLRVKSRLAKIKEWLKSKAGLSILIFSLGIDDQVAKQTPLSIGKPVAGQPVGGIDLNAANLTLKIKRDGKGVPLPLAQQDWTQLQNIQGFIPVIIAIKPVTFLPLLSELSFAAFP